MKSKVMIVKADGPLFEKGDIVTIQTDVGSFGLNIDNNSKFLLLLIDGLSTDDTSTLLSPLVIHEGDEYLYELIKERKFTVDVDLIAGTELLADAFLDLISTKETTKDEQLTDVVV